MKKLFLLPMVSGLLVLIFLTAGRTSVHADWWQPPCPQDRANRQTEGTVVTPQSGNFHDSPIHDREPEDCLTPAPQPTIAAPSPVSSPATGGTSDENPCASGKSFSGDYCGWSPRIGGAEGGGGSAGGGIGEPPVLGLSDTSSTSMEAADILQLLGVLCLLLGAKLKLTASKSWHRTDFL